MENEPIVSSETLQDLKKRGGDWAAFRNEVLEELRPEEDESTVLDDDECDS